MPGPVSDSYDPEWGIRENSCEIDNALETVYDRLSGILGGKPPMYILELVRSDLPTAIPATLTEREWRLLRFAVERVRETL
jgi:hypothetical protein